MTGFLRGNLLSLVLLLCALLPLSADETDPDLAAANQAFAGGHYGEAAGLFQKIVDTRGYSANLCFNLANAEAKAGHPGRALLNFERARYLAPGDIDIDHNLQLTRKLAGLDPNSYRWWQILLRSVNWTVWFALIALCLGLLLIACLGTAFAPALAGALKIPAPTLRRVFKGVFFVGIPLTLFLGFIELSVIGFGDRIEGVIIAPKEATLRLSPFDAAESTGTIPEGELVTVEDRHDDYLRVEARNHHYGWIQQSQIEPVIAGSFTPVPAK